MKLKKAHIKQFRSIEDITIEFDPSCLILLGINESGKSNILKALSLLSSNETISADDVRQTSKHESEVTESSIEFYFSSESSDLNRMAEAMQKKILVSPEDEKKNEAIFPFKDSKLTVAQLIERKASTLVYYIDVKDPERYVRYWVIDDDFRPLDVWWVPTDACPENHQIQVSSVGTVKSHDYGLVREELIPDNLKDKHFRPATTKDVNKLFNEVVVKHTEDNIPVCIFWTFQKDNVLPSSLNFKNFLNNPSISPAIHNMFVYQNPTPVKLNQFKTDSENRLQCQFLKSGNVSLARSTAVGLSNL